MVILYAIILQDFDHLDDFDVLLTSGDNIHPKNRQDKAHLTLGAPCLYRAWEKCQEADLNRDQSLQPLY
ncbi:MAG: hypothetical protein EA414_08725 [Arthrospira sp. PLM2.Bin9]|nr:hypothetical protein [Arthrospira sp. PLM2.Bin9]TVU54115.1 MAG: hypothetical protein EA414_08725 [Arthrospira sp. PLM2.Bin9]